MIVDEASTVPTLVLDETIRIGRYRSKIGLLGDFAQKGSNSGRWAARDLADRPPQSS